MGGEYKEPFGVFEREGEVVSGADFNSDEHTLPTFEILSVDDLADHAVGAAKELIEDSHETELIEKLSVAERAYLEAEVKVVALVDKSVFNYDDAWKNVDPSGNIRQAFSDAEQNLSNYRGRKAIQQVIHKNKMEKVAQILDPKERNRAEAEIRAQERARNERRGRHS